MYIISNTTETGQLIFVMFKYFEFLQIPDLRDWQTCCDRHDWMCDEDVGSYAKIRGWI